MARESLQRHLVLVMHEQLAAVAVVADDPAVLKAYNVKKEHMLVESSHTPSFKRQDKPANYREFPAKDPVPRPMGCEADENQHAWPTKAEW